MNTGWIVLIEGIAIFALLIGFGIWQLRSLKKMEREDKAKAEGKVKQHAKPESASTSFFGLPPLFRIELMVNAFS